MVDSVYQDIYEALKPGVRENEIGALAAASVLAGCAGSTSSAAPSPFTQDDQCRRSGGFWTGSRCAAMGGY